MAPSLPSALFPEPCVVYLVCSPYSLLHLLKSSWWAKNTTAHTGPLWLLLSFLPTFLCIMGGFLICMFSTSRHATCAQTHTFKWKTVVFNAFSASSSEIQQQISSRVNAPLLYIAAHPDTAFLHQLFPVTLRCHLVSLLLCSVPLQKGTALGMELLLFINI